MLSFLKRLSGDSGDSVDTGSSEPNPGSGINQVEMQSADQGGMLSRKTQDDSCEITDGPERSGKRFLSGDSVASLSNSQKKRKRRMNQGRNVKATELTTMDSDDENEQLVPKSLLPEGTPDWGIKLLEILRGDMKVMSKQLAAVEIQCTSNSMQMDNMAKKLVVVEEENKHLTEENHLLKEKVLDLEYRQCRNNLLFEGIPDSQSESDLDCIQKLRYSLRGIPGLNCDDFKIERCHRIDGKFAINKTRRVICCFNWHYEVQCILRNRKQLPKNIYVSKDLPEEWIDRRRVLKPIFNAARKSEK